MSDTDKNTTEVPPVQEEEQTQQQEQQQQEAAAAAPTESTEQEQQSKDLPHGQFQTTRAFDLYDVRQRGWLPQTACQKLLEKALFAHHPERDQVISSLMNELLQTAEVPQIEVGNKEPRIRREAFIKAVTPKFPEVNSAEEVASSFSALKNDSGSNKLTVANFVAAATKSNPAISNEQADVAWNRVLVWSSNDKQNVEFQPYRSVVNSVIHSTKVESKS